jgi:hypothetical protein
MIKNVVHTAVYQLAKIDLFANVDKLGFDAVCGQSTPLMLPS